MAWSRGQHRGSSSHHWEGTQGALDSAQLQDLSRTVHHQGRRGNEDSGDSASGQEVSWRGGDRGRMCTYPASHVCHTQCCAGNVAADRAGTPGECEFRDDVDLGACCVQQLVQERTRKEARVYQIACDSREHDVANFQGTGLKAKLAPRRLVAQSRLARDSPRNPPRIPLPRLAWCRQSPNFSTLKLSTDRQLISVQDTASPTRPDE